HFDHYLALAEIVEQEIMSPDQARIVDRVRGEQDNLRAAMAWSRDQGEAEALVGMVVALALYWGINGRYSEFQVWSEAADRASDVPPVLRARLRNLECIFAILSGGGPRFAEVPALANEALALAHEAGDQREQALALSSLGVMAGLLGDADAMRPYIEEAIPLARSAVFPLGVVLSLVLF